jgi:hypothetical protein
MQPPTEWGQRILSAGVKRTESEAAYSPPTKLRKRRFDSMLSVRFCAGGKTALFT